MLKETTVSNIVSKIKEKYPEETKGYSQTNFTKSRQYINRVSNIHKDELKDVILEDVGELLQTYGDEDDIFNLFTESDEKEYASFTIKKDNYFIILISTLFNEETTFFSVTFFNDINDLQIFYKDEIATYKPGIYTYERGSFGPYLQKVHISVDDEPILDKIYTKDIITETNRFFSSKEFYDKNKLPFKRGLLMYGPPGNGKTSLIRAITSLTKNSYSIMIDCSSDDIPKDMAQYLTTVLGSNAKKILIFEDIDSLQHGNKSKFLNLLDGMTDLSSTFILATTNHIDQLDAAIVQRPSRFDRVLLIDMPKEDARSALITRFFPKISKKVLDEAIRETVGFSGAYFKEIFIYSSLNNLSILESIKEIKINVQVYKDYKSDDAKGYFG